MMGKFYRLLHNDWPMHFLLLFTNWLPDNVVFLRFRGWLIKPFFAKCGKNFRLARNVSINNPINISLGNNVFIAYGTWISARSTITINDEVTIGPYCVLTSSNHKRVDNSYSTEQAISAPIEIGEGCWLGAHCIVTAGCNIGKGSVLGAGAVVVKSIPINSLAVGVPARTIKDYGSFL